VSQSCLVRVFWIQFTLLCLFVLSKQSLFRLRQTGAQVQIWNRDRSCPLVVAIFLCWQLHIYIFPFVWECQGYVTDVRKLVFDLKVSAQTFFVSHSLFLNMYEWIFQTGSEQEAHFVFLLNDMDWLPYLLFKHYVFSFLSDCHKDTQRTFEYNCKHDNVQEECVNRPWNTGSYSSNKSRSYCMDSLKDCKLWRCTVVFHR
jgi:hypothetical protein